MRLMAEVQASVPTLVAYRGRHRWEMTFEAVARQRTPSGPGLRPQGRYVVVGGGSDTGALVARHLCDSVGAACVLIDPSAPSTAAGSAPPYATLEARLDSASELSRALRQAEQRLGGLDGVVYAGASDAPCLVGPLCDLDVRAVASELGRSAGGMPSLDSALQGRRLDFCLVLSSLSSLVGGAWVGGYAACSLLRDSFVRRHNQRGEQPWTLVSFQRWAAETSPARRDSLPAEQALRAIEWLAQHPELEQVAVATGELVPVSSNPVDVSAPEDPRPAAVAEAAQEGPRRVPYVAPRDEAERRVATIWQELLGIARVGVDDDFFDLGGHSLLATRFLVRLEEAQGLKISIGEFFSHPTVAELAVLCRDAELAATSPAELERLLTEMEAMSETDARAELETGAVPSSPGARPPRPE
jgi:acyl carrier protein